MNEGHQLYWGDMHLNLHPDQVSMIDRTYAAGRSHLNFFAIAYYPFKSYKSPHGLSLETEGQDDAFLKDWPEILAAVRRHNDPGSFVTFAGYEWHGDRRRFGDHNVFYFDEGPLDATETLPQLYKNLRQNRGIAIPHHTGYQVGQRGKHWDYYDPELSPFMEIFSDHGSSEGCNTPFTMNRVASMGPRVSGGTAQDGLARGYRLGIIASGDNHSGFPGVWGNGLAAVWATELTREGLWDAFLNRRVYGVTGDRIKLAFELNGQAMGSVVHASGPAEIRAHVVGSQAIDRIELLRNDQLLHTHCHAGTWDLPRNDSRLRLKLRVDFGWGPSAFYGLKTDKKIWRGKLSLGDGRLVDVQGCFSCFGQQLQQLGERECSWQLETEPRPYYGARISEVGWAGNASWTTMQAVVFELEASPTDQLHLEVNGESITFSVREALQSSRVLASMKEAYATITGQLGLSATDLDETAEVVWQNAYKAKIHPAIPEAGYTASFNFVDESPPPGRNWYRLRVSQLNGQMAWSSPIWRMSIQ